MRRGTYAVRAFKKTLRRLHRSKDARVVSFPKSIDSPDLTKLRMLGSSRISSSDFISVGSTGTPADEYYVVMLAYGKNMVEGYPFTKAAVSMITGEEVTKNLLSYPYNMSASPHLTPIFSDSYLTFKENTRYTFAAQYTSLEFLTYVTTGLCFIYDDGSYSLIKIPNPDKKASVYGCCSSEAGKTVKYIGTFVDNVGTRRIYPKSVGLFEGAHTDYNECFEEYSGTNEYITLAEPLRGVGYVSDEIDFLSKTLKRRIAEISITGEGLYAPEGEEGYYLFDLGLPARPECDALVIGTRLISYEELLRGEGGVAISEDGEHLMIRPTTDISGEGDYLDQLANSPIKIMYVRRDPITEEISLNITYREGYNTLTTRTYQHPRRFLAEYY